MLWLSLLWTDRRADRQGDSYTPPPNFVSGAIINHALWPWPLSPKINRAYYPLLRSVWSFMMIDVNGNQLLDITISVFIALLPWPFDSKFNRTHPELIGSLCVKFHDNWCEEKTIMRRNQFTKLCHCEPDRLNQWVDRWYIGKMRVKFHYEGAREKAVMQRKHFSCLSDRGIHRFASSQCMDDFRFIDAT